MYNSIEEDLHRLNRKLLSTNESAIHLLEKNQDKIDWNNLSMNPKRKSG